VSTINGVTLEPSSTGILWADVFRGGIDRVNVTTEAVELVYQHAFGLMATMIISLGALPPFVSRRP
jgi:hypothetical protein